MMKKLILISTFSFLLIGNANSEKTTEQKCIEKYLYKYEDVKYINYCKNIGIYLDLQVSINKLRKEYKK